MHVDASVLVAIALDESDRDELIDRLETGGNRTTSPVSVFEAAIAVGREIGDRPQGLPIVMELIQRARIEIVAIDEGLLEPLNSAYLKYGKGAAHPARLNLGDCFSYALAKRLDVELLNKGDDFAHTDLR
jgi:ribonuclease VapC